MKPCEIDTSMYFIVFWSWNNLLLVCYKLHLYTIQTGRIVYVNIKTVSRKGKKVDMARNFVKKARKRSGGKKIQYYTNKIDKYYKTF